MKAERWRLARALFWLIVTTIFLFLILVLSGTLTIPLLPFPTVNIQAYRVWVFAILIVISTKALLELLKPVFRVALRNQVRYEADIFAYFQVVSYAVWATAFGLVLYIIIGGGGQEFGLLGIGLVSAALIYVLGEPLLNVVGWLVLITSRIYKLGDRIEVNQGKGYVVAISLMNTSIREFGGNLYGDSFTGRYVTIPNSAVLKGNVFNSTKDTPFIWDQVEVSVTYESDHKVAETLILEAAEEIVAPMMRENIDLIRSKYEFADLDNYVSDQPRVGWQMTGMSVTLTLGYFCPVFAKGYYRTLLTRKILEKMRDDPRVEFARPNVQMVAGLAKKEKGAAEKIVSAR